MIGIIENSYFSKVELAKSINENNNDKKLGYVYVLDNLAEVYLLRGYFIKAESLCNMGLFITDTLVAKSHSINSSLFKRLAKIYYTKKGYRQAIALLSKSIETLKNVNPEHIDLVVQLNYLGHAYEAINEYDSAELQFKEALRIAGLHYDKSHKNYINSLNSLAEVLSKQDRKEEAKQLFEESMGLLIQNIYQNFDFLSAGEKQKYLSTLRSNIGRFNLFALEYYDQDAKIAIDMFDNNLFLKGLILTSSKKMKELGLDDSTDLNFRKKYEEWINTKEYLANVYTLTKGEINKREINRDSIESRANDIEKELTQKSAVFTHHQNMKQYSWQDIKSALQKDEAFVQIVRTPNRDSVIYVAIIVSGRKDELPQLVVLNNGTYLENGQYDQYMKKIYKGYNSSNIRYNDTDAYLNYWAKIESLVKDKETVYLLPDGVYNKINVSALLMDNEHFVYENHHIVLLTSADDFMEQKEIIKSVHPAAVLIGAPDFSDHQQNSLAIAEKETIGTNNMNLRSKKFNALPMSIIELKYIDSLLTEFQWKTQLFTGSNATEEIVKSMTSPEILHISTHGFFNDPYSVRENTTAARSFQSDFSSSINPLFLSGLRLSDTQNSLPEENDYSEVPQDGILTAYEVSNLNLDSTQLVVLSACESGLGEIIPGEGVFGLQRAFKIAGAENIIMSLWKVDDRATQLFMKKFYTYWLSGNTITEAFDKSVHFLRFNTQDYKHPVYWGGFVLLGKEKSQNDNYLGLKIASLSLFVLFLLGFVIYFRKKIMWDVKN